MISCWYTFCTFIRGIEGKISILTFQLIVIYLLCSKGWLSQHLVYTYDMIDIKYILYIYIVQPWRWLYDSYHSFAWTRQKKTDCLVIVHHSLDICNFPMSFVVGLGDYIHEIMETCIISVGTKDHRWGNYPQQD